MSEAPPVIPPDSFFSDFFESLPPESFDPPESFASFFPESFFWSDFFYSFFSFAGFTSRSPCWISTAVERISPIFE